MCVCGCVCVCAKERERQTDTERQKECVCVDVCVRQEDLKNLFWRSLVVNLECVAKDRKVSHLSELRNKGETKLANYDYAGALEWNVLSFSFKIGYRKVFNLIRFWKSSLLTTPEVNFISIL